MRGLTGEGQRVGNDRCWPKKELEERERDVMEHWSAAMAAIFVASFFFELVQTLCYHLTRLPLPIDNMDKYRLDEEKKNGLYLEEENLWNDTVFFPFKTFLLGDRIRPNTGFSRKCWKQIAQRTKAMAQHFGPSRKK